MEHSNRKSPSVHNTQSIGGQFGWAPTSRLLLLCIHGFRRRCCCFCATVCRLLLLLLLPCRGTLFLSSRCCLLLLLLLLLWLPLVPRLGAPVGLCGKMWAATACSSQIASRSLVMRHPTLPGQPSHLSSSQSQAGG